MKKRSTKICTGCNRRRPLGEFYRRRGDRSRVGVYSRCKPCVRKSAVKYRLMKKHVWE